MTQIDRILITNGGPHPADKWADVSTDSILQLIEIPDEATSDLAVQARAEKRRLQPLIFEIFNQSHTDVQNAHRAGLAKVKTCQKAKEIDVSAHLAPADAVLALFAAGPFAEHFARPEVQQAIRQIAGRDAANIIHIERCCHSDGLAAKGA